MSDLTFGLALPDETEPYWLSGTVTIGKHLDNDVVVAGEDVRDFHARIEVHARGLRVTPIDGATVHVEEAPVEEPVGVMPDDEIVLGQHRLRVIVAGPRLRGRWALHEPGSAEGIPIGAELLVGRADECGLRILEGHISRRHALLAVRADSAWIKDLGSANGSFVNGERLRGACRLFHGDDIAFDVVRYQLIGDAPDLTPIRPIGDEPDQLAALGAARQPEATVARATLQVAIADPAMRSASATSALVRGPTLVGRSAPFVDRLFPLDFGRHSLGRASDRDIVLAEPSVSNHHAEIEVKADGTYLVNLLSTNGTRVNGQEIHTRKLVNGDEVQLGRVTLTYLEPRAATQRRLLRWVWIWAAIALAALAVLAFR